MGMTKVKLTVKNPQNPKKQVEEEFLVDSGAHYTVLPSHVVEKLSLKPAFEQEFVLADGKVVRRPIGSAIVNFEGRELPVACVLGKRGDASLLGVTTLESFGLMLDPFKRKIYHSKLMLGVKRALKPTESKNFIERRMPMEADARTEAEVMAVLNKLSAAYAGRDVNQVLSLFVPDPDAVLIGTGADERRVGLDQIRVQAERDWAQTEATALVWGPWQTVSSSGSVAWVAADATFKVKAGGQEMTMPGRMTAVLESREGKWLIAQAHFSMPLLEQGAGQSFPTK